MKIVHASDNHGWLKEPLPDGDVVVHSGDFLPNASRGIREIEHVFQEQWVYDNAADIRAYFGDRPVYMTRGNHDFIKLQDHLRAIGVQVIDIENQVVDGFYGFPWVPRFTGEWNFELEKPQMEIAVAWVEQTLNMGEVEYLVSHGPLYGVLDRNSDGERCGNMQLRFMLQEAQFVPKFMFCGHIHEARGRLAWSRGITILNSATIVQCVITS